MNSVLLLLQACLFPSHPPLQTKSSAQRTNPHLLEAPTHVQLRLCHITLVREISIDLVEKPIAIIFIPNANHSIISFLLLILGQHKVLIIIGRRVCVAFKHEAGQGDLSCPYRRGQFWLIVILPQSYTSFLEKLLTWALLNVHGPRAFLSCRRNSGRRRRTFPSAIIRLISS